MQRFTTFAVAGMLMSAMSCDSGRSDDPSSASETRRAADLAAIERLHEADMRAVLAGDAATLISLWTEDIVALAPGAPVRAGRAANAEALQKSMQQSAELEPLEYRLAFETVELLGDHAVEWGTYHGRVRPRAGGDAISYQGKVLRVLRRQPDGSWRVARTMFTQE